MKTDTKTAPDTFPIDEPSPGWNPLVIEVITIPQMRHTLAEYEKDPSQKDQVIQTAIHSGVDLNLWQCVFEKHIDICLLLEAESNRQEAANSRKEFNQDPCPSLMKMIATTALAYVGREEADNRYFRADPTLRKKLFTIWYETLKDCALPNGSKPFLGKMHSRLLWSIGNKTNVLLRPNPVGFPRTDMEIIQRLKQYIKPETEILDYVQQIEDPKNYGEFRP